MWKRKWISNGILAAFIIGCVAHSSVFGALGWQASPYTVTIATHFTGTSQAQSGSTVMTLKHPQPATIQASVVTAGDEVLTSSSSDILVTSYQLTGAALGGTADTGWVASSAFILPARSYTTVGAGPSDITISVQGVSAANRANDAGAYTATIILTATW